VLPTSYILINSDLGTDESIIEKIKGILAGERNSIWNSGSVWGLWYCAQTELRRYWYIEVYHYKQN